MTLASKWCARTSITPQKIEESRFQISRTYGSKKFIRGHLLPRKYLSLHNIFARADHYRTYTPFFGGVSSLHCSAVGSRISHLILQCEKQMRIEIYDEAIGIPALFKTNYCEAPICNAHDPLVSLKSYLGSAIQKFVVTRQFFCNVTTEFIERIDASRGICLQAFLVTEGPGMIDVKKGGPITLRDEFTAFLSNALPINSTTSRNESENKVSRIEQESSEVHDQKGPDAPSQGAFSNEGFVVSDAALAYLPTDVITGECYKMDRFANVVGIRISSGRTFELVSDNAAYLKRLYDIAGQKNSVTLEIQALPDNRISHRARTLSSYSRFRIIYAPLIRVIDQIEPD
ncbi:hypothetical protein PROAA_1350026 [Candidatus Propionivibrio aalborgensis]|jgi:hypothetical protein|uniref:Uncharacterized protein n=1 Tax=Candidatus Propionivibrio aalborgensis TaxID=1860101 RepID=A0A1A8XI16_9RHOO|nr:hypothetical protein PROAA_1350026 [Candidatus Propionivibrio aalborgensis]